MEKLWLGGFFMDSYWINSCPNIIDAKELDSNKKIEALETALNVKFSI